MGGKEFALFWMSSTAGQGGQTSLQRLTAPPHPGQAGGRSFIDGVGGGGYVQKQQGQP